MTSPTTPSATMALKGYELYSWQASGKWYFALVLGTNRLKTMAEITAPGVAVDSVDALRARLSQLGRGEEIIWGTWADKRLALPPQPLLDAVKKMCQDLGLQLTVTSP
ncbi:MAG: hypothetical protein U0350_39645 [Caldilineaceae bacterium]